MTEYEYNKGEDDNFDEEEFGKCRDCGEEHSVNDMKVNEFRHKAGFMTAYYDECPDCKSEVDND